MGTKVGVGLVGANVGAAALVGAIDKVGAKVYDGAAVGTNVGKVGANVGSQEGANVGEYVGGKEGGLVVVPFPNLSPLKSNKHKAEHSKKNSHQHAKQPG